MKVSSPYLFLAFALCLGMSSVAQSKNDIIAAQSSAMDTMERVMDMQHEHILKATERIQDLMQQVTDLKLDLEVVTVANDTPNAVAVASSDRSLKNRKSTTSA